MQRTHRHFCYDSEELEGLLIPNSSFLLFFLSANFRAFMRKPEDQARQKIDKRSGYELRESLSFVSSSFRLA